jgi:hypothetical protein
MDIPKSGNVNAFYLYHKAGQAGAGYPFVFGLRVNGKQLIQ